MACAYLYNTLRLKISDHAVVALAIALLEHSIAVAVFSVRWNERDFKEFIAIFELRDKIRLGELVQIQPNDIAFLIQRTLQIALEDQRLVIIVTKDSYAKYFKGAMTERRIPAQSRYQPCKRAEYQHQRC